MHTDLSWQFILLMLVSVVLLIFIISLLSEKLKVKQEWLYGLFMLLIPVYLGVDALITGSKSYNWGAPVSVEARIAMGVIGLVGAGYLIKHIIKSKEKQDNSHDDKR